MTAGESIKKSAEGAKNVTDTSVDAVETKVNEITDTVESAVKSVADKIHHQAGQDKSHDK
jgi:hypothetical protein